MTTTDKRLGDPAPTWRRVAVGVIALPALGLALAACGGGSTTSKLPSSFDVTSSHAGSSSSSAASPGASPLIASTAPSASFSLSDPGSTAPVSVAVVPTTRPAGALSSCTLLSIPEASAALGQQVSGPYKGTVVVDGAITCVYNGVFVTPSTNPNVDSLDTVRVTLVTGAKAASAYQAAVATDPGTSVSGLGQQASFDGKNTLTALKGNYSAQITVIGAASARASDTQLMKDALSFL